MKKPKIKKRGGVWIVYRDRRHAFTCYTESGAIFAYNLLLKEILKNGDY